MKKKQYFAPEMEVVELNYNPQLLAGSAIGGDVIDDYAEPDIPGLAPGFSDTDDTFGLLSF